MTKKKKEKKKKYPRFVRVCLFVLSSYCARKMGFYEVAKVGSPFDPSNRFETSYILGSSALAGFRLLIALYCFFTNIFKLAWTGPGAENPGQSFSYFTNITYWSLSFYFLFAGYHTFYYSRYGQAPLQSWPRILQFLHSLFYSTIVVFPFVVSAAYWCVHQLLPTHCPV